MGKAESFGTKFANIAAGVGKAAAVGLGAAATAFGGLSIKALQLGGELEQNLGGAEAVFKDWADSVKNIGTTAFETMGLSQSDFLATANKMGALMQGSGLSIGQSMDLSTKAMQRAADVASIMGIDISAAMDSVAGAAKGNFTMMDNLGISMNATTIEAYALEKGINASWKEMDNAQKVGLAMEMFLEKTAYAAGNYAKENETLAGSMSTAKAALSNFLSGAGNIEPVISSVTNLAGIVAKNLAEIIPRLAEELPKVFTALEPMLPPLFDTLLPAIFEGASKLITGLAKGIIDNLPLILESAQNITLAILDGIGDVAPILEPITDALGFLVENFENVMAVIVPLATAFGVWKTAVSIAGIVNAFTKAMEGMTIATKAAELAQKFLNATMLSNPFVLIATLIAGLVAGVIYLWNTNEGFRNAVIKAWEAIKETAINLRNSVVKLFTEDIPNAFNAVINFVKENWQGLLLLMVNPIAGAVKLLYDLNPQFKKWVDGIFQFFKELPGKIKDKFNEIIQGIKDWVSNAVKTVKEFIPKIIDNIVTFFEELPGKALEWGKGLIDGFIQGIKDKIKAVGDAVKSVIDSVADFMGFHSPSKKGEGRYIVKWGSNMIGGFIDGINKKIPKLENTLNNAIKDFSGDIGINADFGTTGGFNRNVSQLVPLNASTVTGSASPTVIQNITLNVKMDEVDEVYKLKRVFENFSHNQTIFGGVQ